MAAKEIGFGKIIYRDINQKLFGLESPYKITGKDGGEITLYVDDDRLSRILAVPEPWTETKRKELRNKISNHKKAIDNISCQIRPTATNYKELPLEESILLAAELDLPLYLKIVCEDSISNFENYDSVYHDYAERFFRIYNAEEILKIRYIKKAIETLPEWKGGGLKRDANRIAKDIYEKISKDFGTKYLCCDEIIDSEYPILLISKMENPTVLTVVQAYLDAYTAYEEALRKEREDIYSRCRKVKEVVDAAGFNGKVKEALKESRTEEIEWFERCNKPYVTKDGIGHMCDSLDNVIRKLNEHYISKRDSLESGLGELEAQKAITHRVNIMNLGTAMGNLDQSFKFNLDKVYLYSDGTAWFEGSAVHSWNLNSDFGGHEKILNYKTQPRILDKASLEEELIHAKDAFNNWMGKRSIRRAK